MRDGVAGDREQREPDGRGRDGDAGERGGDPPGAPTLGERGHQQPAPQREAEEERVGRMDERERQRRHPGGEEHAQCRPACVGEDEREDGRDEQLPRRRRRPREEWIRPAVSSCEPDDRDLRRRSRSTERHRAKEGHSCFECHDDRERNEQRALVLDDERGIDAGELRHRREKRMPERKGVAGMQAATDELVETPRTERPELDELADARHVERAVADQRPWRDVPEQQPEHEARE